MLPGRKINEVDSEKYLDVLNRATGIWFGGGRQWNFVDAYHDTEALKLMHQVLDKGGVIMGSSAGASIQAEYLGWDLNLKIPRKKYLCAGSHVCQQKYIF